MRFRTLAAATAAPATVLALALAAPAPAAAQEDGIFAENEAGEDATLLDEANRAIVDEGDLSGAWGVDRPALGEQGEGLTVDDDERRYETDRIEVGEDPAPQDEQEPWE